MSKLDPVEGRVVGSLVEKQLTTPQQYPLTLNSLTLACNQTSNRDPIMSCSEPQVQSALDSLKTRGLVRFVLPSHGRSVVRYRHVLDEKLALDARQLSLVGVLLLRGPQTIGELRTRTERMAGFGGLGEVESDLEGLSRWEEPLVARLPRRPGQKEERWAQLVAEEPEGPGSAARERWEEGERRVEKDPAAPVAAVDELRAEVALLREELQDLREELNRLKGELGE